MQTLTEQVLKLAPPGGLFDETVVRNLFPAHSEGARKVLVHRATSRGEVLRLKPGLFVLAKELRRSELHPFVIAAALHSPSQVSLESALSYHGLIPEALYQVSSVTVARSRTFKTPLGFFTFQRVPSKDPRAGVQALRIEHNLWAFVATPLRAIADLVYLSKGVSWRKDGPAFLTESMRVEEEDLAHISFDGCDEICRSLCDRRMRDYLAGLRRELGS